MLLLVLLGRFPRARPEAAPGGVAGPGVPPPALALPGDLLHGPKDGILHDLSAGGLQLRLFRLTSRLLTLVQRPHQSKAHSFQEAGRLSPVDICCPRRARPLAPWLFPRSSDTAKAASDRPGRSGPPRKCPSLSHPRGHRWRAEALRRMPGFACLAAKY